MYPHLEPGLKPARPPGVHGLPDDDDLRQPVRPIFHLVLAAAGRFPAPACLPVSTRAVGDSLISRVECPRVPPASGTQRPLQFGRIQSSPGSPARRLTGVQVVIVVQGHPGAHGLTAGAQFPQPVFHPVRDRSAATLLRGDAVVSRSHVPRADHPLPRLRRRSVPASDHRRRGLHDAG